LITIKTFLEKCINGSITYILALTNRHGNGVGWERVLPSSSPSPTPIYIHVTLHISNGNEIQFFGYSRPFPIPAVNQFFLIKKEFFLSFNGNIVMHYPTICVHFNIFLSNNFVLLTINESSYIMTIIKPNNMAYHYQPLNNKKTWPFYIRVGFGYGFGVDTYIPVTRLEPIFWNRRKLKPNQIEKNPSNWSWFGRVSMDTCFVAMPTYKATLRCVTKKKRYP